MEKTTMQKMVKQVGNPKSAFFKKIDTTLCIQRDTVWTDDQASLFIHSLIDGYPVPPLYVQDNAEGVLALLDGKQRTHAITAFYANKYKLSANTPALADGTEIAGKKYSTLPENVRDILDSAELTFYVIRGLTEETRDELFFRINNGSSLKAFELTRAMAGEKVIGFLKEIAERDFFAKSVIVSKTGRKRFVDNEIITGTLSVWLLRPNALSGKELTKFCLEMKANPISEEVKTDFMETISYLEEAMPSEVEGEAMTYDFLKRVNIPVIAKIAQVFLHNGKPACDLYDFLDGFFSVKNKHYAGYKSRSASGTATLKNIRSRYEIMEKAALEMFPDLEIPATCDFSAIDRMIEEAKVAAETLKAEKKAAAQAKREATKAAKAAKEAAKAAGTPVVEKAVVEETTTEEDDTYTFEEEEDTEDEPATLLDAIRSASKPVTLAKTSEQWASDLAAEIFG